MVKIICQVPVFYFIYYLGRWYIKKITKLVCRIKGPLIVKRANILFHSVLGPRTLCKQNEEEDFIDYPIKFGSSVV